MTQHYLEKLFAPSAIAVIGASERHQSVGMKVLNNLLTGNYQGKLYAINPKHDHVQGLTCHASLKEIKAPVDLAIIATPARYVPDIIKECGENNIHAAIVLSSGFSETGTAEGKALEKTVLDQAKLHQMRIVGPNCLGIMRPSIMMNATFDNNFALPGSLAFVSQSGALSASILDWAMTRKIGFSTMVSMGNNADIDFGDIIDYLALDPHTESILLYIEGIRNPRHFMSALRAASRIKPVIALKAGKHSQGSRAALSHTGALIGSDDVFDAALRRAGAVRVMSIEDLFSASEILATPKKIIGNRLAIITNGGGAGVLAADRASELNVTLPTLTSSLIAELNQVLPTQWSHQNPIDIIGDATPERYHSTLDICNHSNDFDAILTILVPVSMSDPQKVAKQIIKDTKFGKKLILACWMGEKQVRTSWKLFAKHQIPYFNTPEKAIEAFSYLADYYHNQQLLMQVPDKFTQPAKPNIKLAASIIDAVLAQNRTVLTAHETKNILAIFGIPVTESIQVSSLTDVATAAKKLDFPVVMKINSPDISHKAQAGGVRLNIQNESELIDAYHSMRQEVSTHYPKANILGVTLESQYKNLFDREVMVGIVRDIVFGPIISIGTGGGLVELLNDKTLALPPLNHFIINHLIKNARILKPSGKLHSLTAAQIDGILTILLAISEMACELPHIQEMDINPLILTKTGMIAVDARMVVSQVPPAFRRYGHLVIHPYPHDLISTHTLPNHTTITVRPIRPEDADLVQLFTKNLSSESKYLRFMGKFHELNQMMLVRLTQIDYDREMALLAIHTEHHEEQAIGIVRYVVNPDGHTAEFSIVIADDWQHQGVGTLLMNTLCQIAEDNHITQIIGFVLATNIHMLRLSKSLGFTITTSEDPTINIVTKNISQHNHC